MNHPKLELNVEQLVLKGLSRSHRSAVRLALHRELSRLFAEHGVPPQLAEAKTGVNLDNLYCKIDARAKPDAVGARIAQAIYHQFEGK